MSRKYNVFNHYLKCHEHCSNWRFHTSRETKSGHWPYKQWNWSPFRKWMHSVWVRAFWLWIGIENCIVFLGTDGHWAGDCVIISTENKWFPIVFLSVTLTLYRTLSAPIFIRLNRKCEQQNSIQFAWTNVCIFHMATEGTEGGHMDGRLVDAKLQLKIAIWKCKITKRTDLLRECEIHIKIITLNVEFV